MKKVYVLLRREFIAEIRNSYKFYDIMNEAEFKAFVKRYHYVYTPETEELTDKIGYCDFQVRTKEI